MVETNNRSRVRVRMGNRNLNAWGHAGSGSRFNSERHQQQHQTRTRMHGFPPMRESEENAKPRLNRSAFARVPFREIRVLAGFVSVANLLCNFHPLLRPERGDELYAGAVAGFECDYIESLQHSHIGTGVALCVCGDAPQVSAIPGGTASRHLE